MQNDHRDIFYIVRQGDRKHLVVDAISWPHVMRTERKDTEFTRVSHVISEVVAISILDNIGIMFQFKLCRQLTNREPFIQIGYGTMGEKLDLFVWIELEEKYLQYFIGKYSLKELD